MLRAKDIIRSLKNPAPRDGDEDTEPRPAGCQCTWEFGDSACSVHPTCNGCGVPAYQCECPGGVVP